ncbi:MAG: hypothetical protein OXF88_22560, partial [Rhodobacteraceae bacterium]|nr:hypothetical protein [Paracoccaceae bacterium]
ANCRQGLIQTVGKQKRQQSEGKTGIRERKQNLSFQNAMACHDPPPLNALSSTVCSILVLEGRHLRIGT